MSHASSQAPCEASSQTIDEHQQRHYYLATLGIDSWLARTNLPGAGESDAWVKKFLYEDVASTNTGEQKESNQPRRTSQAASQGRITPSDSAAKSNNAAQARALAASFAHNQPASEVEKENNTIAQVSNPQTASSTSSKAAPSESATDTELTSASSQAQKQPSIEPIYTPPLTKSSKAAPVMRLMFWLYEDVLVVDSLPAHSRGTLSSVKYEQLLTNLIRAMGCDSQRIMISNTGDKTLANGAQPFTLNWPTLAGLSIDQGWEQAVSAVQHKLAKTLNFYQPKVVLMLGEHCAQMLMNLEDDFEALRGVPFTIRQDITAITSFSLTQMLNIPGCKREVWADLQPVLHNL